MSTTELLADLDMRIGILRQLADLGDAAWDAVYAFEKALYPPGREGIMEELTEAEMEADLETGGSSPGAWYFRAGELQSIGEQLAGMGGTVQECLEEAERQRFALLAGTQTL